MKKASWLTSYETEADHRSKEREGTRQVTESQHYIEDLVAAVRDLPPSSGNVVTRFAIACYDKGRDDGTILGSAVAEIVRNWPDSCVNGQNDFLEANGVVESSDEKELLLGTVTDGKGFVLRAQFNRDVASFRHEGGLLMHIAVASSPRPTCGRNLPRDEVVALRDFCNKVLGEQTGVERVVERLKNATDADRDSYR